MNIIIFLFFTIFSLTATAQSPWYFGSGKAVNLTNAIRYKNGIEQLAGGLDPSATAVSADTGSIYLSTSGTAYLKQDNGLSTNWLPLGVATTGTVATINGQSGPAVSIASGSAGTDFAVSASSNVITLDIPSSSASARGLLTSANWTTFNNKEPAITATSSSDYYRGDKTFQPLNKTAVGLSNVDNTSDATKNAATATLTNKTLTSPVINSPTGIVKGDVGLGNVDNTSDANKPVSTATQTALDAKVEGTASSVDSEVMLFSSTTGKAAKRATGTGFAKLSSGVLSTSTTVNAASELTGISPVANGGTGANTLTANNVILGNGSSAVQFVAPGSSGKVLKSNGTTWASAEPDAQIMGIYARAGQAVVNDAVLVYDTTIFTRDANIYNTTTGVGTFQTSGTYMIIAVARTVAVAAAAANSFNLAVNVDGIIFTGPGDYAEGATSRPFSAHTIAAGNVSASDTFQVQFSESIPSVNLSSSTPGTAPVSYLIILKVGH